MAGVFVAVGKVWLMLDRLEAAPSWGKGLLWLLGLGLFVQLAGLTFNNDGSRYANQVYLLLLLPALVLLMWLRGAPSLWKQLPALLLLLLMCWALLVGGVHEGSDRHFGYWLKVVVLLLLYVFAVAMLVGNERRFTWVVISAVAVTALSAWLTLYYQFGVLDRPLEYSKIRWARLHEMGWNGFADLDHPIVAGLYYGVFAVLLTWLFVRCKVSAWQTALLALGMSALLVYVLLTFSRGAWFSVLASSFVLLLLFPNRKSNSLLGAGILLIGLALYLFWPEIQNEQRVGVNGRHFIWAEWLSRLPDFWLMGAGAGHHFYFVFPGGRFAVQHAHSLYLQLWFEYGIVGILLFAAMLISLLWKGWSCRTQPLARLGLALLVFAIVAMVSDVYAIFTRPSSYWVLLWFPVGILLGVQKPAAGHPSEPLAPPAEAD
jgi:hypothetical protein